MKRTSDQDIKMIALLFGSFNPVHRGHVAIAEYTLELKLAEQIWFVVSPQNPLKDARELAPFEDRLAMVAMATQHDERMVACAIEQTLSRPSYTINTMRALLERYPGYEFMILAGSDIATQLNLWRESQELQRLARFMIYPRCKQDDDLICSAEMVQAPRMEISSTSIRADLEYVRDYNENLMSDVLGYINTKNLYTMKTVADYTDLIKREPDHAPHYYERGMIHYRNNDFGSALNDFNQALSLDQNHCGARHMKTMTESIFNFRNTDIYNP